MAMRLENTADVRSYIYYAYICVSIPRSLCEKSVYLPDFTPVAPVASNIRTTSCAVAAIGPEVRKNSQGFLKIHKSKSA